MAKPRLPSGFRFWPTDEVLVVYYLRWRTLASPLPAHDPSDLLPPGECVPPR